MNEANSAHIKNMRRKQLSNRKVQDFAMVFRARKVYKFVYANEQKCKQCRQNGSSQAGSVKHRNVT